MNGAISQDGTLFQRLDAMLRVAETAAALVAAVALAAAVIFVSFDAMMRYFLNAPIAFQYTLTESYLLVMIVTLSMAWGFRTGGYIRIGGATSALPQRASRLLIRAGLLASTAYVGVLAWKSAETFLALLASGETGLGAIQLPVWMSWVWVPIGLGLLCLRLLLTTFGPAGDLEAEHDPEEEI